MLRKTSLILLLAALLAVLAMPSRAEAAEFLTGANVTVGADEVINDDLYASGGTVTVRGTINGDLVAAGGNVNVEGTINGDVIVAGGNLNITGTVRDTIRAAGGQISVHSSVGGDVIVAGGSTTIGPGATVGRDLVAGTGDLQMAGVVERNVRMGGGSARIDGTIRGNVQGNVDDRLVLGPGALIEGNLDYQSRREATLEPGAQVLGQISRTIPTTTILGITVQDAPWVRFVQDVVSQVRWFLGITLVGLLLLWLFPRATSEAAATPVRSPWRSLGMGVGVLILAPIVVLIIAVIALFVTGFASIPVLLIPGALYFVLLSLAAPIIAILIGALILTRSRSSDDFAGWQALLIGAAILAVIGLVPFLNTAVTVLTLLFGFGAWLLFLYRSYTRGRRAEAV